MKTGKEKRGLTIQGLYFAFFSLLILSNCAKELAPSGGPKDITPPMVVRMKPGFGKTNFTENKIVITFNEFIQLTNPEQKVIVSPPLNYKPTIKLKGKSIHLSLKDTLKENTTYNVNFNDVIRDYTEGNIAHQFQYVFSTGNLIDTIFVSGKVVDASTGKPLENVQVGLYSHFADSAIAYKKPDYFGITDRNGVFTIHNIHKAEYRINALMDIGNDMFYTLPNERIAYLSKILIPEIYKDFTYDTLKVINEINETSGDTLFCDSLIQREVLMSNMGHIKLNMFTANFFNQFVKEKKRPARHIVNIIMNQDLDTVATLKTDDGIPFISIKSTRSDSLLYFVPDSLWARKDSITALFSFFGSDSLKNKVFKTDTLLFIAKQEIEKEDTVVVVSSNIRGGKLEIDKQLELYFSHPIDTIDLNMFSFFQIDDTIKKPIDVELFMDSTQMKTTIDYVFNVDYQYELKIDSLAVKDIYGLYSMPEKISFKMRDESEYGILALTIVGELDETSIIELLDKNMKVIWRKKYPTTKSIVAKNIEPGKYQLRLIVDSNKNGLWDTGDYYKHIQPEEVIPFQKEVFFKANWDTEIVWKLN